MFLEVIKEAWTWVWVQNSLAAEFGILMLNNGLWTCLFWLHRDGTVGGGDGDGGILGEAENVCDPSPKGIGVVS